MEKILKSYRLREDVVKKLKKLKEKSNVSATKIIEDLIIAEEINKCNRSN